MLRTVKNIGTVLSVILAVSTAAFAEPCRPSEPAPGNLVDPAACKATPLTLTGPDTWAANTTWTASGGVGPYAYTAGFPLVSGTGTATATSGCGTQTITATDRCGNSVSKQLTSVALTISGPDDYVYGAYNTTGGKGAVKLNNYPPAATCGSATITATDECGGSASKIVRLSQGHWVTVHSYNTQYCSNS